MRNPTRPLRREWLWLAAIVVAAIGVRVGYLYWAIGEPGFVWVDPDRYSINAQYLWGQLSGWGWHVRAVKYEEFVKAPLYVVFLSPFVRQGLDHLVWAGVVQAVASGLSIVAVFVIGQALHSSRAGLVAALIQACYLPSAVQAVRLMQEQVSVPLLLVAFALLARGLASPSRTWVFAMSGVGFGLSALARSVPLYYMGPVAVLLVAAASDRREGFRHAGALLAGFAMVVVPYACLISLQTGQLILIENVGAFAIARNNPSAFAPGRPPTTLEVASFLWSQFTLNPWLVLTSYFDGLAGMFKLSGGRWLQEHVLAAGAIEAVRYKFVAHAFNDLIFAVTAVCAPMGVVLARNRRLAAALALWILVGLGTIVLAGYSGPRFREPLDPFLMLFAACAITGGWRRPGRASLAAAALLSITIAGIAARSLPSTLSARADYGVAPWTWGEGTRSTRTIGAAGFRVWVVDGVVDVRITRSGADPMPDQEVDVRIDGRLVARQRLTEPALRLRFPTRRDGFAYVEMSVPPDASASVMRLGIEVPIAR